MPLQREDREEETVYNENASVPSDRVEWAGVNSNGYIQLTLTTREAYFLRIILREYIGVYYKNMFETTHMSYEQARKASERSMVAESVEGTIFNKLYKEDPGNGD